MAEIKFEIIENLGTIGEGAKGWKKECIFMYLKYISNTEQSMLKYYPNTNMHFKIYFHGNQIYFKRHLF